MDAVEHVVLLGDLEQRARVDLGDLLHASCPFRLRGCRRRARRSRPPRAPPRSGAAVVLVVERLARDLLGGEHREVGDLLADLLERAAGLLLDVAARLLPSAPRAACWPPPSSRPASARPPCARATTMSSACSRASRSRARYSLEQLVGLLRACARRRRSTPRSPCGACRAPLRCAGTRACCRTQQRDPERDQRPDHQPELGLTRKLPPLPRRRAAMSLRSRHRPSRGRTRSGRR